MKNTTFHTLGGILKPCESMLLWHMDYLYYGKKDEDGYFCRTIEDLMNVTNIGKNVLYRCMDSLIKYGFVTVKRRGKNSQIYIRSIQIK